MKIIKNLIQKKYWFQLSFPVFNLLFALFSCAVYNFTFFERLWETPESVLFKMLATAIVFGILVCVQLLVFWKATTKYIACLLMVLNAVVSYFIFAYNVVMDKVMMLNVLNTAQEETMELLGWEFLTYLLCVGMLPCLLLIKTKIIYRPWKKEVLSRLWVLLAVLPLSMAIVLPNHALIKDFLRENFGLRYVFLPTGYISSMWGAIKIEYFTDIDVLQVNVNPAVDRYWADSGKKNLFVFILGETARDANFSLNGYHRPTNAPLMRHVNDMAVFKGTHSCATTTRISVPCIFLPYTRETFRPRAASYTDSVLDVLHMNGYQVTWLENDSACKGLCRKIDAKVTCSDRKCFDERLTEGLFEEIGTLSTDALFVLHQHGSHGPMYYKRYPKELEQYSPICDDENIKDCTIEELVNVYDNSIYYSSYLMADLMDRLEKLQDKYNVAIIYTSDHGESLGENGLYLHGVRWEDAPAVEKEVPFFIWVPEQSAKALKLDMACVREQTKTRKSHDNIFHSLLGLSGVKVDLYDKTLDIFAGCIQKSGERL